MARGWLAGVVLVAACGPLTGFQVEDRSTVEQVLLPMRCLDSLGRTNSGMWVCRTNSGIFASRGGDESNGLEGAGVVVGGGAVWTWDDNSGVLLRFEEDPDTGRLFQSPDAGYRWMHGPVIPRLRAAVAHEGEIVLAASGLEVVRADAVGFTQTSHASTSFDNSSIAPGRQRMPCSRSGALSGPMAARSQTRNCVSSDSVLFRASRAPAAAIRHRAGSWASEAVAFGSSRPPASRPGSIRRSSAPFQALSFRASSPGDVRGFPG